MTVRGIVYKGCFSLGEWRTKKEGKIENEAEADFILCVCSYCGGYRASYKDLIPNGGLHKERSPSLAYFQALKLL